VQRFFALEEEVRTLHQEVAGRVAISSIYSVGLTHLNDLVRQFSIQHPKTKVSVEYHHPHRVYEMVEQDQVDLGMVSYPRSTRTIKGFEWCKEPVLLVMSPTHRLADRGQIEVSELDGLEIVGFDTDLKVRQEIDRVLALRGVTLSVVMKFDNIETIKRAVAINQSASLLPAPAVQQELATGELVCAAVDGLDLWRPVGFIKRRGVELGKTARRFLRFVQERSEAANGLEAESLQPSGNGQRTAIAQAKRGRRDAVAP
jgi:DNA-binding transcriptional LysR family regulator